MLLFRKETTRGLSLAIIALFVFTSCTMRTAIKPYSLEHPINFKGDARKKAVLSVTCYSNNNFVRLCAPAGNCTNIENSNNLNDIVTETVKTVLVDKGFDVSVSRFRPKKGEEYFFQVDVEQADIKWQAGMLHSEAELFMRIRNQVESPSGERLLNYTFEKRGKEGGLLGNCCAVGAGLTIVGVIPFLIYVYSVGDETTQLTEAGNKYLTLYAKEYAQALTQKIAWLPL